MGLVDREGVLLTVIILLLLSWVCWRSWKRCIKTRLGGWSKDAVDIFGISPLSLLLLGDQVEVKKAGRMSLRMRLRVSAPDFVLLFG
jgi:hypothetical protein